MTVRKAVALLAVTLAPLRAQWPAAPAFQVASVRRNTTGDSRSSLRLPETGTVSFTNVPIRVLILQAYQMDRFKLVTAVDDSLLEGPRFDVQAKPPDDAPPGQQRLMLQRLLADRFNLRMHRERRPIPVYVLK